MTPNQTQPFQEFLVFHLHVDNQVEKYAIPISEVQEILNSPVITTLHLVDEAIVGVIDVRGQMIALLDTKVALYGQKSSLSNHPVVVVVQSSRAKIALLVDAVDSIIAAHSGEVKPISSFIPINEALAGLLTHENSLIALLNSPYLVEKYLKAEQSPVQ